MFLCFNHESLAFFQDPKFEKTCSNFAFDPSRSTAAIGASSLTCAKRIQNGSFFFRRTPFFFQIADNWGFDAPSFFWARTISLLIRLAVLAAWRSS